MKNLFRNILGGPDAVLQGRIVNISLLMATLLSIQSGISNYMLGLHWVTWAIGFFSIAFFFIGYLFSVKTGKYLPVTYLTYIYLFFVFTPVLWFTNGGSEGGFQYYTILFTILVVGVVKGKSKWFFLAILLGVILASLYVEYKHPGLVRGYDTREERYLDIAVSYTVVILSLAFLILAFINQYLRVNDELENKNKLLSKKNEEITNQRTEIENQKVILEKSFNKITDSIRYAGRIQQAMLSDTGVLEKNFGEHFILFLPRDQVSGDFYFFKEINNNVILSVADCTGHGVPGAFVSILGISSLNEIIVKKNIDSAAHVLEELREKIKFSLKQSEDGIETRDGMDISLCTINTENMQMQYAGANLPVYVVSDGNLRECKPTKSPIGIYFNEKQFENRKITLKKGDMLYMFSDGYADQVSKNKKQKFLRVRFKELLVNISGLPAEEQKNILLKEHYQWRGDFQQLDDILIIGVRI